MTAPSQPEAVLIKDFSASAQISLFQKLKQEHFSGQLHIQELNQRQKWVFFLYVGRIIHATGGIHEIRRWRRNLVSYLPHIAFQLEQELENIDPKIFQKIITSWDYKLLTSWVAQKKVSREQANQVIRGNITEILFDIAQAGKATYYLKPQEDLSNQQLVMIDSEQQIIQAWKLWQTWKEAGFAETSPNLAPTIIQLEQLQKNTSEKIYQTLTRLLTGKHSLRDLGIQKKASPLTIARLIMPHLKLKLLKLIEIPDISLPVVLPNINSITESNTQNLASESLSLPEKLNVTQPFSTSTSSKAKLVAYVNRNPLMSKIMAQIIKGSGYDFITETDPTNAIATFLDFKPDIIFIDTELSEINGYELCSHLRQIDYFGKTPIILFSKSVNTLDRVKAKMVGCSELLSKATGSTSILNILYKYFS